MDWYEAVGVELAVTWGTVSRFQWDLHVLHFVRAQTCWLEGTDEDLRDRRRAVLGVARGVLNPDSDKNIDLAIDKLWPMLPVESISPHLANLICVAYKDKPERSWTKDEADGVEHNKAFESIYEALDVDEIMDMAYRAALFVNSVLILWDEDEGRFLVLTPEYFRITDEGIWVARRTKGPTDAEVKTFWLNKAVCPPGEIVFDVWTHDGKWHRVMNHSGQQIEEELNPYGMLPGVLMKLNKSNDLYGAGISGASEINAATNLLRLFAMRTALFNGFPVAVGVNMQNDSGGAGPKEGIEISPGQMVNLRDPDGTSHPDFKYVSPEFFADKIEDFRQTAIKSFERNEDLPAYLIDESLSPPSGVSLQVMEQPLRRKREKHLSALRRVERTLAKFIQALEKKDHPTLVCDAFEIVYADAQEFTDPAEELNFDLTKAENGFTTPSALARKYLNKQRGITDDEAVAEFKKNKQALSFLVQPTVKESISD